MSSNKSASAIANAANAANAAANASSPSAPSNAAKAVNAATVPVNSVPANASAPANAAVPVVANTAVPRRSTRVIKSKSVRLQANAVPEKKQNNALPAPTTAILPAPAPVVAAAANAVVNAKGRELCFIYSNALTKDTFKKGCIVVYKGDKSSPDHSAKLLEQLLAQKDLQVVKGGLQKSFVQPVDDKTSLFIAYVEVTTVPTDEQIKAMKATISQALPKMGGKRKRFHTKKRHAKKKTTRRRS
jgi:hypothetical protein